MLFVWHPVRGALAWRSSTHRCWVRHTVGATDRQASQNTFASTKPGGAAANADWDRLTNLRMLFQEGFIKKAVRKAHARRGGMAGRSVGGAAVCRLHTPPCVQTGPLRALRVCCVAVWSGVQAADAAARGSPHRHFCQPGQRPARAAGDPSQSCSIERPSRPPPHCRVRPPRNKHPSSGPSSPAPTSRRHAHRSTCRPLPSTCHPVMSVSQRVLGGTSQRCAARRAFQVPPPAGEGARRAARSARPPRPGLQACVSARRPAGDPAAPAAGLPRAAAGARRQVRVQLRGAAVDEDADPRAH